MTSTDLQLFSNKSCEENWSEFLLAFPTESSCVEELFRRVFDREFSCLNCGSALVKRINNSRITYCYDCKVELHTLAGTFFHNIRRARAWAGALWLMERGVPLNSCQFARLAAISPSSAQKIFKDLSLLLLQNLDDDSLMDSYSFLPVFNRRSRVTPAGQPPQSEEASLQNSNEPINSFEDQMNFIDNVAATNGITLDDEQWRIIKLLADQPCDEDEIAMRTGYEIGTVSAHVVIFQIYGIAEMRARRLFLIVPKVRRNIVGCDEANRLRTEFIRFVSLIFGSISRKYVQNYLGWFWSVVDRKAWPPNSINAELFRHGRMSPTESRDYISPMKLKCPLSIFCGNVKSVALALAAP